MLIYFNAKVELENFRDYDLEHFHEFHSNPVTRIMGIQQREKCTQVIPYKICVKNTLIMCYLRTFL